MFGFSTVKLIGAGIVALAILAFITLAFSWRSERDKLLQWQGQVVAATTDASGLKDGKGRPLTIKVKDVPEQIRFLGEALNAVRLKTAQARADDLANAHRVEAINEQKGDESVAQYKADLAAIRARYADLMRDRGSTSGANSSRSGGESMPCLATASGFSCNPAEEKGLLSADDALIATEQAYQLNAILNWGKKVGIVKSTDPPKMEMHNH